MKIETVTSLTVEALVKNPTIPAVVRSAFSRTVGYAQSSEHMMWREVAARLTLDAFGIVPGLMGNPESMTQDAFTRCNRVVRAARRWFNTDPDSELVFDMAGVEIEPVARLVRTLPPLACPVIVKKPKPRREIANAAA